MVVECLKQKISDYSTVFADNTKYLIKIATNPRPNLTETGWGAILLSDSRILPETCPWKI